MTLSACLRSAGDLREERGVRVGGEAVVACGALGQILQGDVAEGGEELLRRGRDLEDLHEELHADRLEQALLDQRPGARHLGGRLLE